MYIELIINATKISHSYLIVTLDIYAILRRQLVHWYYVNLYSWKYRVREYNVQFQHFYIMNATMNVDLDTFISWQKYRFLLSYLHKWCNFTKKISNESPDLCFSFNSNLIKCQIAEVIMFHPDISIVFNYASCKSYQILTSIITLTYHNSVSLS